jgi:MGT family glycosyltransferase
LEDDRPILLVTCSSEYQNDGALAQAAIDAFGADPRLRLLCTTAGVDPATVPAPSGVIVERFASHALVLPRAFGLICHGGMGATQRALAAGVAPVVVPFGRDQLEVAQRVVQARAGAMVPRARLTPERLRDAVERSRGCAAGVAAVQAGYVAAGGAERGATLLEGLLGARDRAVA